MPFSVAAELLVSVQHQQHCAVKVIIIYSHLKSGVYALYNVADVVLIQEAQLPQRKALQLLAVLVVVQGHQMGSVLSVSDS